MLFENAVKPGTLGLLKELISFPALKDFGLAGGTSLALRYGHRESIDLDLFVNHDFDAFQFSEELQARFPDFQLSGVAHPKNTINGMIRSVKIDCIAHKYPLLAPYDNINDIRLFSAPDVAAMKLNALSGRGLKKDFWDVARLLDVFSLREMLDFYKEKYSQNDVGHVIRSLAYFEEAEQSEEPILSLDKTKWADVKSKIITAYKKLVL